MFCKYKHIISLGCGCDIAMRLTQLGIRQHSYVFDWLFNFDGGLSEVLKIIQDNFYQLTQRENFSYEYHPRWADKKVLVNIKHPIIRFIHHNPLKNDNDYKALVRRSNRFKNILTNDKKVLFIYYRVFHESNQYKKNLDLLYEESNFFAKELHKLYPDLKFDLLALISGKQELLEEFQFQKSQYNQGKYKIFFDSSFFRTEEDEDSKKMWGKRWDEILFNYKAFPATRLTFLKFHSVRKKIKKTIINSLEMFHF